MMDVTESRNPLQGLSKESSVGKRKILPDDHCNNNDSAYGSPAPEEGWGSFDSDDSYLHEDDVKKSYSPKVSPKKNPLVIEVGPWQRVQACVQKIQLYGLNQKSVESILPLCGLVIVCLACIVLMGTFTTGVDRSSDALDIEKLNGKYKSMAFANSKIVERMKREERETAEEDEPLDLKEGEQLEGDFLPPLSDELAKPEPEEPQDRVVREDGPFRFRKRPKMQASE